MKNCTFFMYILAAVICGVCTSSTGPNSINSTAAPMTTVFKTTKPASNVYYYTFDFETSPPLSTVNKNTITQCAKGAAAASLVVGVTVEPVTKITKSGTAWEVELIIGFPSNYSKYQAEKSLVEQSFAVALEKQMQLQPGFAKTVITAASVSSGGDATETAGIPTTTTTAGPEPESCGKSPLVALLFTLFLGGFGAGRFYYGYIALGVLWLCLTLFAHIFTAVGSSISKMGCQVVGFLIFATALCVDIGLLVWWIYDLVVISNESLKPFGAPENCDYDYKF